MDTKASCFRLYRSPLPCFHSARLNHNFSLEPDPVLNNTTVALLNRQLLGSCSHQHMMFRRQLQDERAIGWGITGHVSRTCENKHTHTRTRYTRAHTHTYIYTHIQRERERGSECVCVCLCVRQTKFPKHTRTPERASKQRTLLSTLLCACLSFSKATGLRVAILSEETTQHRTLLYIGSRMPYDPPPGFRV